MEQDRQSRKFQLTINNCYEKGITHEKIKATLETFKSILYYCMADEVGQENQTPHTHIFISSKTPIRFSTLKKRFPEAHIEQVKNGTAKQNRDYIVKEGNQFNKKSDGTYDYIDNTGKRHTGINHTATFEEWGNIPKELGQGYRTDITRLYEMIVEGMSNAEIMAANPNFATHISLMDKIRQDILEDRYKETFRQLSVTYIWGETETGKTRSVLDKYGYSAVYRITDYNHPFDRYSHAQNVICFDEFRSSLCIGDMLNYLDGYPLNLPARYTQRVACYTEVYIISNIDLKEQYFEMQKSEPSTWHAFLRRIGKVVEYRKNDLRIDHGSAVDYIPPVSDLPIKLII